MLELMRDAVVITIAGVGGGAIAIAAGFGVEAIVAWI